MQAVLIGVPVLVILVLLYRIFRGTQVDPEGRTCRRCHQPLTRGEVDHGPVCFDCDRDECA